MGLRKVLEVVVPVDGLGGVESDISKHLNRRKDSISCFKSLQIWRRRPLTCIPMMA